jgi:hypothetical protein
MDDRDRAAFNYDLDKLAKAERERRMHEQDTNQPTPVNPKMQALADKWAEESKRLGINGNTPPNVFRDRMAEFWKVYGEISGEKAR